MPDLLEATQIVRNNIPNGKIQCWIIYRDLYLFQVFTDLPFEEDMDPFYSVNMNTGEFKDFSIITDGDIAEITSLFENAITKRPGGT